MGRCNTTAFSREKRRCTAGCSAKQPAPDHAEPVRQLSALYREAGRHAEAAALYDRLDSAFSRLRDRQ